MLQEDPILYSNPNINVGLILFLYDNMYNFQFVVYQYCELECLSLIYNDLLCIRTIYITCQ